MIPRRSGRIINIASIAGEGLRRHLQRHLCREQGAVISLTKTAAQQLGPHNINVNAVCPGIVRTNLYLDLVATIAQGGASARRDRTTITSRACRLRRAR